MELTRVVFRPATASGGGMSFSAFVNIPNLQLDQDEFVYVLVDYVSMINLSTSQNLANVTSKSYINLVSNLQQYPSYDTGINKTGTAVTQGACTTLATLVWDQQQGGYHNFIAFKPSRVPVKMRINMLQGKTVTLGFEYNDGTPVPAAHTVTGSYPYIVLAFYK